MEFVRSLTDFFQLCLEVTHKNVLLGVIVASLAGFSDRLLGCRWFSWHTTRSGEQELLFPMSKVGLRMSGRLKSGGSATLMKWEVQTNNQTRTEVS